MMKRNQSFIETIAKVCLAVLLVGSVVTVHASVASDVNTDRNQTSSPLVIYGAAYFSEMKPVLEAFEQEYPNISVDYTAISSNILDAHIRENKPKQPDVTISSVMDLQIRLVNDGYARPHTLNISGLI